MCLLTVFPQGAQPNPEHLKNGARYNNDGHGFAILVNGQIVVRRSMISTNLIDEFVALRKKHPDGPALFHSRITTHGVEDKTNCHPFRVPCYTDTYVAHNGVLPTIVHPDAKDRRSDTRVFAEDFLPMVSNYGGPVHKAFMPMTTRKGRDKLAKWMGTYNKVAIITTDSRFTGNLFILNQDQGEWANGVWYSNTSYLPFVYRTAQYWTKEDEDWYAEYRSNKTYVPYLPGRSDCPICRAEGSVGTYSNTCYICRSCVACTQSLQYCTCNEYRDRRREVAITGISHRGDEYDITSDTEEIDRIQKILVQGGYVNGRRFQSGQLELSFGSGANPCEFQESDDGCGNLDCPDCYTQTCTAGAEWDEQDEWEECSEDTETCTSVDCVVCSDHNTMQG